MADPTIADILAAFERQQAFEPLSPAVVAWSVLFDVLREQIAAAAGSHPLRA